MTHNWQHTAWAHFARARVAPGPTGTVLLARPDLPHILVYVRPCWRRRVGLVWGPFATRSEMRAWWSAWGTE